MSSTAVELSERRLGQFGDKYFAGRPQQVLLRNWISFKSSAWIAVVSGFLEPVLYLLSFGYGVGALVGNISTTTGQVSYAAFIAPGLLASSAMNGALLDSTWNVFFKLNESRLYNAMLATSLGPLDVALGEIAWALMRGGAYATAFTIIMSALGLITTWWGILAIPAAIIVAFGFASFGMAITSYMKSHHQMNFFYIFLLPMFLFSGAFYPLTVFPGWGQAIIKALPLRQGIELVTRAMAGEFSVHLLVNVTYFLVMICVGLFFTTKRLNALFMK
ncbi:MAG: ABC transporter [Actinobacteria bacterium]|jgi:lipooligosaccharide transport system permease protein|nr:ABC transporter [Actinomycetota bacterium]